MDRSGKSNLKLSVEYEGVLQNQARALLTQELLKYFLFQLCQIPSNYEAVHKGGLKEENSGSELQRFSIKQRIRNKKIDDFCASMTGLLLTITNVFSFDDVCRVAFVFGSTVMSPKFTIMLTFPQLYYNGPVLDARHCLAEIYRKVFQVDRQLFSSVSKRLTKMYVLFYAKRAECFSSAGLQPRPLFKACDRDKRLLQIDLVCKSDVLSPMRDANDIDNSALSGFSPLDDTLELMSLCNKLCHESSEESSQSCQSTPMPLSRVRLESVNNCEDVSDFIWYLAPMTVCGFK